MQPKSNRRSASFTKEELDVAEFIMSRVPTNPILSVQARSKAFASLYRKLLAMKRKVDSPLSLPV